MCVSVFLSKKVASTDCTVRCVDTVTTAFAVSRHIAGPEKDYTIHTNISEIYFKKGNVSIAERLQKKNI